MKPRSAKTAARDAEALKLRLDGMTFPQIADQLGFASKGHAFTAVRRALADSYRIERAEAVRVEQDRLDMLTRAFTRVMDAPGQDPQMVVTAGLALLRVSESRRRMLGLDAPPRRRIEVITEDAVDAEIARLEARLAQLAEDDPPGI